MIRRALMIMLMLSGLSFGLAPTASASYNPFSGVDCNDRDNSRSRDSATNKSAVCNVDPNADPLTGPDGIIIKASRIIAFVAGAAAIIMIILGGIRYITSNGDSGNVKSAKDTVFFSIIGLAVIVLAQTLIEFVISKLN